MRSTDTRVARLGTLAVSELCAINDRGALRRQYGSERSDVRRSGNGLVRSYEG